MARKKNSASYIRRTHRSLGASAAVFIIFVVITGIAINHSHSLGLDRHHLSQSFLLKWYGLAGPEKVVSYEFDDDFLSVAGSQVYLNESPVSDISNIVGAAIYSDIFIIASKDELLLLDQAGQLIERQPWQGLKNAPIASIGFFPDGAIALKSDQRVWRADADLISWKQVDDTPVQAAWSMPVPTPAPLLETITQQYRGKGPSLERLLLDLHSGRFFGPIGLLVYDLIALVLGFLAISGLVLWFRGNRNGKSKRERRKRK